MSEDEEEKKNLKVVKGDGTDLNISTVYEHVKGTTPNGNTNTDKESIVIPKKSEN